MKPEITAATERFFKKAIGLVVEEITTLMAGLQKQSETELRTLSHIARQFGLQSVELSPQGEALANRLEWGPIAESYLLALLEPLIDATPTLGPSAYERLWATLDKQQLARENGLNESDADLVFRATGKVLLESDLLALPVTLDWDGRAYDVRRERDQLETRPQSSERGVFDPLGRIGEAVDDAARIPNKDVAG